MTVKLISGNHNLPPLTVGLGQDYRQSLLKYSEFWDIPLVDAAAGIIITYILFSHKCLMPEYS